MLGNPSLFKRLMFSVLLLSFLLWLLVLSFMLSELKKVPERFSRINLEIAAQQQLSILNTIPHNDDAIRNYAFENDVLQKKLYEKLSIFVAQYYLQVWRGNKIIYSPGDLPTIVPAKTELKKLAAVQPVEGGKPWLAWSEYSANTDLTVRVIQKASLGFSLSYRSFIYYVMPFMVSVPFLIFPLWWAISRGLRPLNQIALELAKRTDSDLTNINNTRYRELAPIVNAINRLMDKVKARIQREQEFLHDAAHELKTPLAVIQLNSEILISTADEKTKELALLGLQKGVVRAVHTTHQLLAAARADNHNDQSDINAVINISRLLQERLAQWISLALQKNIDIELDAPALCELKVSIASITLLVDNLIDNAIKYSDHGTRVQVHLSDSETAVSLEIIDQGCGIPDTYREKVFERFFRINNDSQGTGLGLSIVKRIAQQHAATIELSHNVEAGQGLCVKIIFQKNSSIKN